VISPVWDLDGFYAVTLSWQQWLRTDGDDPVDGVEVELSADGGQSWTLAASFGGDPTTTAAVPRWHERNLLPDTAGLAADRQILDDERGSRPASPERARAAISRALALLALASSSTSLDADQTPSVSPSAAGQ